MVVEAYIDNKVPFDSDDKRKLFKASKKPIANSKKEMSKVSGCSGSQEEGHTKQETSLKLAQAKE